MMAIGFRKWCSVVARFLNIAKPGRLIRPARTHAIQTSDRALRARYWLTPLPQALLLASLLLAAGVNAQGEPVTLASWNVLRLGDGGQKSYPALAQIVERFDLVALQEVMNEEGLSRLKDAVVNASGEPWEGLISEPVGRRGEPERYAFLWRPRTVQYVDGAALYVDPRNRFDREPFSARFRLRSSGNEVTVATVHVRHGKDKNERRREAEALAEYWTWLRQTYGSTPPLLMGDFNLEPQDKAWTGLRAHARPLLTDGASTLSTTEARVANLYDNIWVPTQSELPILSVGVLTYPSVLGWSHKKARRHVSDHAPVYIVLKGKK